MNEFEQTREIDLTKVVKDFSNSIKLNIKYVLLFFKKNIIWLILLLLAGSILGYLKYKSEKPTYKYFMTIGFEGINSFEMKELIKKFNYLNFKNSELISANQNIILSVESDFLIDLNNDGIEDYYGKDLVGFSFIDTSRLSNKISLEILTNQKIKPEYFVNIFNRWIYKQSEFVNKINNYKNELNSTFNLLETELSKLYRLQEKIYNSNIGYINCLKNDINQEPIQLLHDQILIIEKNKYKIKNQLIVTDQLFVIESPLVLNEIHTPSIYYSILKYALLFIAVFIAIKMIVAYLR